MDCTVTLPMPTAIGSVSIADHPVVPSESEVPVAQVVSPQSTESLAELGREKQSLEDTCQVLQHAADQLSQTCQALFSDHRDQIAQLAVEIARVVLMQKVLEGAYDIEAIVKESLSHAPTREDLTIRVNPQDLADCCAAQSRETDEAFAGLQFVADHGVGRAECVLESPRGVIQSMIDEHLCRIAEALKKTG
jgi:flagellar biosynthesis/type III secretory pathway protein FliH